ncbi:MAG: hypothetical protein PHS95_01980 [Candidatus Pacebacteria bacterium]|nr:hypothetical protein [Candidatus Paceibacterota bacterium]
MKMQNQNKGFIRLIILAIVVIFLLAYFKIDVVGFVNNTPVIREIWGVLVVAWTNYLLPLLVYLWTSILGILSAK